MTVTAGERMAVHQFIATLDHDDVGTHTLRLRDALRRAGRRSEIFAETIHDDLAGEAFAHWTYPEHSTPGDVAVYQVTTPSVVAGYLAEHGLPLVLDLHVDTGPQDYVGWEPELVERAIRADEELAELAPQAILGLARGEPGTRALQRASCRRTVVVPVLTDVARVTSIPDPRVAAELAHGRAEGGADVLFVGSVEPSNAQHELVKALWAFRRLYDGRARLHLVGRTASYEYSRTLLGFVQDLGLATAVRMHGDVSDASLAALYAAADVYLSLSGYQGATVPLIEAMTAGRPVVLRDTGEAGDPTEGAALVLAAADPSYVAAALHRVGTDECLRAALTAAGRRRAAELSGNAAAGRIVETISGAIGRQ